MKERLFAIQIKLPYETVKKMSEIAAREKIDVPVVIQKILGSHVA